MINRAVTDLLGSQLLERAALTVTASHTRVLAYHGVDNAAAFENHLEILRTRYEVVDPEQFLWRTEVGGHRPSSGRPAVLITFDDGSPTVIRHAMPLLNRYEFKAVMFICPAVVDTLDGYWWQVVERAVQRRVASHVLREMGLDEADSAGATVTALKRVDDGLRRAIVGKLAHRLEDLGGGDAPWDQLGLQDLRAWINEGHAIGNHTWDHPILPTCMPEEQRRQVGQAHEWLIDKLEGSPVLFAYPNGDWSSSAEDRLRELGYRGAFLFDHRLNRRATDPLRMSRLRVDASAGRRRFRSITSGIHSGVFHRVRNG